MITDSNQKDKGSQVLAWTRRVKAQRAQIAIIETTKESK